MFAVSAVLSLIMMLVTHGKSFSDMLFVSYRGSDTFMDFFNSIRDASTKDIYKNGIIYPPLANLFFYVLSQMISPELASTEFFYRYRLQNDLTCVAIYLAFVFVCLIVLTRIMKARLGSNGLAKASEILPIILCFSFPMIYCVERGNIALVSLVFSMFFVFYRNSENKWLRELSFVLLAVAAGLKLYPALFGLLLITDKQYKRAARLMLYGVFFLVVPFFFYDGFESVRDIYNNIKQFSEKTGETPSPMYVSVDIISLYIKELFGMDYRTVYLFLLTLTYCAALVMLFVMPEEWQKVTVIAYMIMNYTATSRSYILVLILIPFIMFLCRKEYRKRDVVYFVLFCALLIVIPTLYYNGVDDWVRAGHTLGTIKPSIFARWLKQPNQLVAAFALQGMTAFMFGDMLVRITKNEVLKFKPKHKNKTEKNA